MARLFFRSLQCRVLLNLRTSQPFEEVLEDLGQVLKINGAKKMYTGTGQEVSRPIKALTRPSYSMPNKIRNAGHKARNK